VSHSRVFRRTWTNPRTGEERESEFWYLDFTDSAGKRQTVRTDPPTGNRRVAEEQLRAALRGERASSVGGVTMTRLLTAYLTYLEANAASTYRSCGSRGRWWASEYGSLPVSSFGLRHVDEGVLKLQGRKLGDSSIGGYLTILRAAFNRGVLSRLIPVHECCRLEIGFRAPIRHVFFSAAEVASVVRELPGWAADVVRVSRATGIRLGDVLALRWENVREDRLVWNSEKPGMEVQVPLTVGARAVIEAIPKRGPFLFPAATDEPAPCAKRRFYRAWFPAMVRAKLTGKRRFHDLRRTWANELHNAGGSDRQVATLLGQKSTSMVPRYTRSELESLRALAERAATKEA
jgi:integrase